jgi:hypothetical protein
MLNSRYAPVVALAVLGILLVLALGWFLAVSPKLGEAQEHAADEQVVRANIGVIESDAAALDNFADELANLPALSEGVELNAASRIDQEAVRARLSEAVVSSGVEIASASGSRPILVESWLVPPTLLQSTAVAARFQSGPVGTTIAPAPAFEPVVSAPAGSVAVAGDIASYGSSLIVVGSPQELYAFLLELQRPDLPLYLISQASFIALHEGSSVPEGVSTPAEGDAQLELIAGYYSLNPDPELLDEEGLEPVAVPGESPFEARVEPVDQPGAN